MAHLLIAILFGALAYCGAALLRASHQVAVVIGVVVGLLVYFGAL